MRRRAWLAALLVSACAGTETGNPFESESAFGSEGVMGIAPEPVVDGGIVGLARVELVGGESCDEVVVAFEGELALDLVREGGDPLVLELREGSWCAIGLRFESSVVPTLEASGSLRDGATFQATLTAPIEARLEAPEPFVLVEGDGIHFVLRWEDLFATASLSTAPRNADGEVVIDEASDPERAAAIAQSLGPALRAVRDTDGDGVLDREERGQAPIAIGTPD